MAEMKRQAIKKEVSSLEEYFCTRCKFKFKIKQQPMGKRLLCPYCGKDDKIVKYNENEANQLLKEASDARFNR